MPRPKPISASNPPESRGTRLPKDTSPQVGEELVENEKKQEVVKPTEQVVYQSTIVESSPKKSTKTKSTKKE